MSRRLPERINPQNFAKHGKSLQGEFSGDRFVRLRAEVEQLDKPVAVSLAFAMTDANVCTATGKVTAKATVTCQRCLELMEIELRSQPMLAFVDTQRARLALPEEWDTVTVDDEPLDLVQLIEDELLLQLPDFPKHQDGACELHVQHLGQTAVGQQEQGLAEPQKENPFAVLKQKFKSGD